MNHGDKNSRRLQVCLVLQLGDGKEEGAERLMSSQGRGKGGGLGIGRQLGSRTKYAIFVFFFFSLCEKSVSLFEEKGRKYAATVLKNMKTQKLYLTITHRHFTNS